jgi:DNA-binding HxlR family transcriptional regulator
LDSLPYTDKFVGICFSGCFIFIDRVNMYKKKIEDHFECGVITAMKVFGAKWKPCIINAIGKGSRRPSEIHKAIVITSPRVIDVQLKELIDWGVVEKTVRGGYPLHVEYALTEFGLGIFPIIIKMREWGIENKGTVIERFRQFEFLSSDKSH